VATVGVGQICPRAKMSGWRVVPVTSTLPLYHTPTKTSWSFITQHDGVVVAEFGEDDVGEDVPLAYVEASSIRSGLQHFVG